MIGRDLKASRSSPLQIEYSFAGWPFRFGTCLNGRIANRCWHATLLHAVVLPWPMDGLHSLAVCRPTLPTNSDFCRLLGNGLNTFDG